MGCARSFLHALFFLSKYDFAQIPTTVMATVDSSVGGKTGVNHPLGKNMIGAFYQPQCVLIDTELLDSLPRREHASGISEIVKYGLIRDPALFHWLEENMETLLDKDPEVNDQLELNCFPMLMHSFKYSPLHLSLPQYIVVSNSSHPQSLPEAFR